MIPLLFFAIALGIGLTAYEFSPRAHAWTDEHVEALRDAIAAHRAAEAHLVAAQASPDPVTTAQHAQAATEANRVAAQSTAIAAKTAKTDPQRAAAAQSATAVVDREVKIKVTLADIGVGQCAVHSYAHVTPRVRDALLARLHGEGMTVTGNNPWDIDTHNHDVKLRAVWDPATQVLRVIVTSGAEGLAGFVVCAAAWAKIDPIMKEIIGA